MIKSWTLSISSFLIIVSIPILLTLASVRVVMSPLFLNLEYHRSGFPDDYYGFTLEDRLHYAPFALDYLLTDVGIDYLADLEFPEGGQLFNPSELKHMEDVKVVTRAAFFILLFGTIAAGMAGFFLWRTSRSQFYQAVLNGGVLTWGLLVFIVIAAVTAWDFFFTAFHELFFEEGTWLFLYSDTLIRLFPEQFWFDAALTIGALTLGGATLLMALSWRNSRRNAL